MKNPTFWYNNFHVDVIGVRKVLYGGNLKTQKQAEGSFGIIELIGPGGNGVRYPTHSGPIQGFTMPNVLYIKMG